MLYLPTVRRWILSHMLGACIQIFAPPARHKLVDQILLGEPVAKELGNGNVLPGVRELLRRPAPIVTVVAGACIRVGQRGQLRVPGKGWHLDRRWVGPDPAERNVRAVQIVLVHDVGLQGRC